MMFKKYMLIIISIAYSDTTIVFSEPVTTLDKMVNMHNQGCADSIKSSDGGKTWKIPNIRIEKNEAPGQYAKGAKVTAAGGGLCSGGKAKLL
jgi:hypothetical protein